MLKCTRKSSLSDIAEARQRLGEGAVSMYVGYMYVCARALVCVCVCVCVLCVQTCTNFVNECYVTGPR